MRFYLQNNGMSTPKSSVGFSVLLKQIEFMGFGLWTFFEGFWLVVLLFFILSFYNRHYAMSLIYFVPIAILSIVSFTVFDITRSGSYMFYIVFPMLIYIYKYIDANSFRLLLFFSAIVSFVFPAYYIIADTKPYFLWYKPIFIRGADYLLKYYSF